MHISQFKDSKFLKKEDCGKGILVTMAGIEEMNVAPDSQPAEMKFVLKFAEDVKPMVINNTNAQLIAKIVGSEETEDWAGHQIVCFLDPTVSYAGKVMGGIRVRAPRVPTAQAAVTPPVARTLPRTPPVQAPAPLASAPEDDDVPF